MQRRLLCSLQVDSHVNWRPGGHLFLKSVPFGNVRLSFLGVGVDFFLVFLRMPKNKEAVQNDLHIFLL